MTLSEYIRSKGVTVPLLAQEMNVSRQAIYKWGKNYVPTAKTLKRISAALGNLGVTATPVEIFAAIQK